MRKLTTLILFLMVTTSILKAETEPNDLWNQSNLSTLGATGSGNIAAGGDYDWWRVSIPDDGKLTVNWTSISGVNVYCEIYDTLGVQYFTGNYTTGNATINIDGLAKGFYYLRFRTYYASETGNYSFVPTFTAAGVLNNPEEDSIPSLATSIAQNDSVTGHIGYFHNNYDDLTDWYKVTTTIDGRLNFSIYSLNGQNIYAELFSSDGLTYLSGNYTSSSNTFSKDGMAPGIYYIRIRNYYASEFAPYALKTTLVLPVNSAEPGSANDFPTQAKIINVNDSVNGHIGYSNYLTLKDTLDWYKFTTTTDGQVNFSLYSLNGQNVYAELFDADGVTFLGTGNYTSGSANYYKDGLAAGTYYLRIKNYYVSEWAPYSIKVTLTSALNNDAENNGTPATALPLSVNTTVSGHINYYNNLQRDTFDYYILTLPVDGKLSITQTSLNNQNVYATLFDHDGTTTLLDNYTSSTLTQTQNNLAAGTYYLRLRTYYGSEFAPYTLSTLLEPMNFPVESPSSNDFAAQGTILPANTPTGGHIAFYYNLNTDNKDWWQIGYDGNGTMDLHMDVEQNHFNTDLPYIDYAFYSDTTALPIYSGQLHAAVNTINMSGLAIGKYFLKISNAYSTFGAYQLTTSYIERCLSTIVAGSSSQLSGCQGTITYNLAGGLAPYSVQLYKNGTANGSAITGNSSVTFNGLGYGTYTAKVYSFGGSGTCNNVSSSTVFSVPASPVITNGGSLTFCSGGSVTLTSSSATSYLWSTGATTQSITATATGNYTVRATNAVGCTSTSATTSVTVNPLPSTPTITTNGPITFCSGGSVTLTSSSTSGNSWSTGATSQSISTSTTGAYLVTVTNGNGCSATSASTSVTVSSNPIVTLSTFSNKCTTDAAFALSGGSPAGGSYSGTGVSGGQFNPATAGVGTFNITYSYTNGNGCSGTATQSITVTNCGGCTPTISANGPTSFCQGGSVILTSSVAASYSWSTGASTQSITVSTAGTYTVTVSNGSGCTGSNSQQVSVNALPSTPIITAGGTTIFCAGGSVTLTSSASSGNSWSTGATTQSISATATGSYLVTVTNANGCSATSAATPVTANSNPVVTLAAFAGKCTTDAAFTLTGGSPTGGTYSGTGVSGGQFNPSAAGAGTFVITYNYTNGYGCSGSATQSITVSNCGGCTPTISAGGPVTFCSGGSVTLTASAGTGYVWSNGATTASITVNTNGNYIVTVTNANNCTGTSAGTLVTVNALPSTPTISAGGPTTFCSGGSVTLSSSSTSGNSWSNGTTTQSITVSTTGNYQVTVTNGSGCTKISAATSVTVNTTTAAGISGNTSVCSGGTTTLTASSGASYLWSTGASSPSINVSPLINTAYTVTVTSAGGCTSTASVIVTVSNCNGTYCTANGTSKNKGYLYKVCFNSISKTSGWNGYNNFTNLSTTVSKNRSYFITVSPGYSLCTIACLYTGVWIDWNQDGDFDDAGEKVFAPSGSSLLPRIGYITIPSTALTGTTKMRVIMKYGSAPTQCGTFQYGEVEDYSINIINGNNARLQDPESSVTDEVSGIRYSIFPNPVSDQLAVERTVSDENNNELLNSELQLTDMNGKIIVRTRVNSPVNYIDVSKIESGIYFVKITDNTNQSGNITRIVITH